MNPSPRQLELIEEVRRLQTVTVEALGERFGVTLQTVRRDVRQLTDAGLLARFHGGVRMPGSTTQNIEYRKRQQLNADAKQRIAGEVARDARAIDAAAHDEHVAGGRDRAGRALAGDGRSLHGSFVALNLQRCLVRMGAILFVSFSFCAKENPWMDSHLIV